MGWAYKKLGDVCDFQNGFAFKSKFFTNSGIPILRISNIQDGRVDLKRMAYTDISHYKENLERYKVEKGELLIAMSGATTGKIGINHTEMTFLLNQRVGKFIPKKNLDKDYLFYYLSTKVQEHLLISAGAAQPNLSTEQIKSIKIPLPPLPEQQRIVAILDQAFADIEKARANAERNLKNACELFDSYLNQVFTNLTEDSDLPLYSLKSLVDRLTNGYVGATRDIYQDSGVPYLLARQVKNNILKFDGKTYVSDEFNIKNKKSILKKGDVLLVQSGHIGHSAVVPKEHEGHNCHAMIVITPKNSLDGNFLSFYFSFLLFTGRISEIRSGSTVPHLTCKLVKELLIPLPSLILQARIVENIQILADEIKRLEKSYQQKLESLDELKKSLLQKAFSGELTQSKGIAV